MCERRKGNCKKSDGGLKEPGKTRKSSENTQNMSRVLPGGARKRKSDGAQLKKKIEGECFLKNQL